MLLAVLALGLAAACLYIVYLMRWARVLEEAAFWANTKCRAQQLYCEGHPVIETFSSMSMLCQAMWPTYISSKLKTSFLDTIHNAITMQVPAKYGLSVIDLQLGSAAPVFPAVTTVRGRDGSLKGLDFELLYDNQDMLLTLQAQPLTGMKMQLQVKGIRIAGTVRVIPLPDQQFFAYSFVDPPAIQLELQASVGSVGANIGHFTLFKKALAMLLRKQFTEPRRKMQAMYVSQPPYGNARSAFKSATLSVSVRELCLPMLAGRVLAVHAQVKKVRKTGPLVDMTAGPIAMSHDFQFCLESASATIIIKVATSSGEELAQAVLDAKFLRDGSFALWGLAHDGGVIAHRWVPGSGDWKVRLPLELRTGAVRVPSTLPYHEASLLSAPSQAASFKALLEPVGARAPHAAAKRGSLLNTQSEASRPTSPLSALTFAKRSAKRSRPPSPTADSSPHSHTRAGASGPESRASFDLPALHATTLRNSGYAQLCKRVSSEHMETTMRQLGVRKAAQSIDTLTERSVGFALEDGMAVAWHSSKPPSTAHRRSAAGGSARSSAAAGNGMQVCDVGNLLEEQEAASPSATKKRRSLGSAMKRARTKFDAVKRVVKDACRARRGSVLPDMPLQWRSGSWKQHVPAHSAELASAASLKGLLVDTMDCASTTGATEVSRASGTFSQASAPLVSASQRTRSGEAADFINTQPSLGRQQSDSNYLLPAYTPSSPAPAHVRASVGRQSSMPRKDASLKALNSPYFLASQAEHQSSIVLAVNFSDIFATIQKAGESLGRPGTVVLNVRAASRLAQTGVLESEAGRQLFVRVKYGLQRMQTQMVPVANEPHFESVMVFKVNEFVVGNSIIFEVRSFAKKSSKALGKCKFTLHGAAEGKLTRVELPLDELDASLQFDVLLCAAEVQSTEVRDAISSMSMPLETGSAEIRIERGRVGPRSTLAKKPPSAYVRLDYGDVCMRTGTVCSSISPEWQSTFRFRLTHQTKLTLTAWKYSKLFKNRLIATCKLDLADIGSSFQGWLDFVDASDSVVYGVYVRISQTTDQHDDAPATPRGASASLSRGLPALTQSRPVHRNTSGQSVRIFHDDDVLEEWDEEGMDDDDEASIQDVPPLSPFIKRTQGAAAQACAH